MADLTVPAGDATREVFQHHLGAFAQGLDEILRDYDNDSVLVTPGKTWRGVAEIRAFFKAFLDGADPAFWAAFAITSQSIEGEIAWFAWEAKPWVVLATDTLFVKNGKIAVQTFTSFTA
jgi:hypothetical protein